MRILHVYRTYFPDPPGGLQEAIKQIATASAAHGVESRVFALSPDPIPHEIVRSEACVYRCKSWAAPASCDLGDIKAIRIFAKLVDWADIIHYQFPWPFADLLHLIAGGKKPAVMTYHSDIVRQSFLKRLYAPLMHRTLSSMSAIVATSPAYSITSPVLLDRRHADRVRVIPLGIDECSYLKDSDDSILHRLGMSLKEPYFLFIGVLRYYKGLQFLIKAAAQVNANVIIAGTGPEGGELKAQAEAIGGKNLIFAGQVTEPEKAALLKHCRALVLPSHVRSEAFGMVLIEAGIYGRPMVSCEVGSGTSFANADEETGFVVTPEDPQSLALAMNRLLEDDDLANRFGFAARQRYERLFSGPSLGRAYAQLYRDVLAA